MGLAIGALVVVIVVLVVGAILVLAKRIGKQAGAAIEALDAAQKNTLPLWEVQQVNESAKRILTAMRTARKALGG